ncbi:MAG: OB-fold nucleic acid binding domain-containing protein, partial [Oscillospiraceae bacterium]
NEGIIVLPPNINTSDIGFTCNDDKSINFGLLAVKNLGKGVIIKIINERENNGKFTSLFDFCERLAQTELNKKAIESLIKCGAFDTFDNNRMEMMRSYEKIIDTIDYDIRKNVIGQIDFFSAQSINKKEFVIPKCENYSHKELLNMEKEVTGLYVSGHPLDEFNSLSCDPKYVKIATLLNDFDEKQLKDARVVNVLGIVVSRKILNTKSGNNMAFIKLEDKSASIEVIAFPNVFAQNSSILQTDSVISINGKISLKDDESPKIIIETVVDARKLNVRINKTMYIKLKSRKTEDIDIIVGILKKNSGTDKVMIYIEDEKKYISREDIKVNCNETLLSELKLFVGDTNVVIKSDK